MDGPQYCKGGVITRVIGQLNREVRLNCLFYHKKRESLARLGLKELQNHRLGGKTRKISIYPKVTILMGSLMPCLPMGNHRSIHLSLTCENALGLMTIR